MHFRAVFKHFAARRGRAARPGWVGLYSAAADRIVAAASYPADEKRPHVIVAPVFDGADPAAAAAAWQAEHHARAQASVLLNSVDYRMIPIEPPAVPPEEMRAAVRWQLAGLIDFPPDEASVDLLLVPGAAPGAPSRQAFAVATRAATVRDWMQRCRAARIALGAIDIPEMAMRNLSVLAAGGDAHAFVHLGLKSTRLVLVWQRELCAFRQFDVAAYKLDAADDATRETLIERLAVEIQRSTDSFSRQFHGADLRTVWVSAVRESERISQQLAQLLPQQVHAFRVEDHVSLSTREPVVDAERGLDFTFPIGAALRHRVH